MLSEDIEKRGESTYEMITAHLLLEVHNRWAMAHATNTGKGIESLC